MAKTACWVFGAILAVVGLWGFVQNPVLDIFASNTIHSLVHLISGLVLLATAMWWAESAGLILIVLGAVYAVIVVLGFTVSGDILGVIDNTTEDNWLHAAIAIVFLVLGFTGRSERQSQGGM
ncbi:MAG: hypothetical protein UY83_C0006G0035 [Candidatus Adlerbacteria bacterium GW2011_GWA1_54_10]|uniref:DUF4383 domain-containing protein n=3 Tax=Candidatus Adleribacteriota TaxID=1752736 RepID=A0A1F4XZL9_9BACT|nr:MAG: hypothetical protein UY83_C0006G0035 [Candidatus Adlerbacteria bacterium GW2011_GWA1_54_10]KKW37699.1 MAG: hypothetical protein UY86_C0004G0028 [Candidatus Adlerbacteria bacterium GW2011_GWB1_54_7]OGC87170.1 MAG: hypothetical protein A3B33_01170 [Candidatus Adlerbacteria bacterium RIFCSPLOWO2_01_FULL_54_16]